MHWIFRAGIVNSFQTNELIKRWSRDRLLAHIKLGLTYCVGWPIVPYIDVRNSCSMDDVALSLVVSDVEGRSECQTKNNY